MLTGFFMRFSIRDVLWLTMVVAVALGVGLGWWRDRSRLQEQMERERHSADQVSMVLSKLGFVINHEDTPGRLEFFVPDNLRDRLGDTVDSRID
jgi:hypothetical protein